MSQGVYEGNNNKVMTQSEEMDVWERMGAEMTDLALGNKDFRTKLDTDGFDIVIFQPYLTGEVGYHLAHRSGATTVLMVALQNSASSFVSWAIGQPHNPAYLPNFFVNLAHPMTFWERLTNTYLFVMEIFHRQI